MSDVAGRKPGDSSRVHLSVPPRRRRRERLMKGVFLAAGLSSLLITAAIVLSLVGEAVNWLRKIELSQLWGGQGWLPLRDQFDLKTLFVGTLEVTGIAMLIATPLGLGAAVYLSEYARPRARKLLKPILEILAGIPSIVLGFFAIAWITPEIVKRLNADATQFNILAAGLAVGILSTPLVASVSEDAFRAVPQSLREASYGLGARRKTTSLRVVFPAAISGVTAAIILATSRAIGETMIVAVAAGGSNATPFNTDVFRPGQTITGAMAALATGGDAVAGDARQSLFFLGLLLFFVTLLLNIVGDRVVARIREKY
ncbi:MAG: phosphate ABC transporter permease subunit PstC [Acidimicrobiia bacterium]